MNTLLHDLHYAVRRLQRAPGFALMAILVMALGIGANVALFTVVRSVLLKPLPFKDPSRLLMLYEQTLVGDEYAYNNVAGGIYAAWVTQNHSFSSLALSRVTEVGLSGSGGDLPETLKNAEVSSNLFSTLGVEPALGRGFTAADDTAGANGTAVLSWSLWKRRFGGDPGVVNKTVYIDAKPYTVIGVMPAWFEYPEATTQIWIPVYQSDPERMISALDNHMYRAVGRLKPGVTPQQATADLAVITRQLHDAHLDNPFVSFSANSRPLLEHMVGPIQRPLYVLLAATSCLLLIACLNVANLLVARAAARRKELAIRAALGSSRTRLFREHLIESFLLAAVGGAAGLAFAYGATSWLVNIRHDMARANSIHIDGVVAAFAVGRVALCALVAGLISALNADNKNVLTTLHESSNMHSAGKQRAQLRKILLAAEVGLTVVLLVGASLLIKSYERLRTTDMGCATNNVLTMRLSLPYARYKTPGPAAATFVSTLLERVRTLPGVEAAGFVTAVPGQGYYGDESFKIVEDPPLPQGQAQFAIYRYSDPGYFAAMGIPILRGHTFDDGQMLDHADEVIISESFARKFFPGEDPIGKHIRFSEQQTVGVNSSIVVGVVGDTRYSIGEPAAAIQYYPIYTGTESYGALVIRSSRDVAQLAMPVQRVIQGMDRDLPVADVLTMDQLLGKSTLDQSFNTTLLSSFALLSLLLAAVGLFGVLSYIVAQRTSEIGIRIALGAQRQEVLRLMLVDGLWPAFAGLVLGLAASAATVRLMRSMLYETQPLDPMVFAAVTGTLLLVAAIACLAPAWRASRLDPVQALRTE
ncbi:MAG TPA: ABC transporter permease [Terracidiphilus sp.]|nr:ABC transporter permease [Terracidiphilus sp.]